MTYLGYPVFGLIGLLGGCLVTFVMYVWINRKQTKTQKEKLE